MTTSLESPTHYPTNPKRIISSNCRGFSKFCLDDIIFPASQRAIAIQGLEQSKKEASSSKEGSRNNEVYLRSGTGKDAHLGSCSLSRDVGGLGGGCGRRSDGRRRGGLCRSRSRSRGSNRYSEWPTQGISTDESTFGKS